MVQAAMLTVVPRLTRRRQAGMRLQAMNMRQWKVCMRDTIVGS